MASDTVGVVEVVPQFSSGDVVIDAAELKKSSEADSAYGENRTIEIEQGEPFDARVVLKNNNPQEATGTVDFLLDGPVYASQPLTVPGGGGTATAEATHDGGGLSTGTHQISTMTSGVSAAAFGVDQQTAGDVMAVVGAGAAGGALAAFAEWVRGQ